MWRATFSAGNLHVQFDERDLETERSDRHRARSRLYHTVLQRVIPPVPLDLQGSSQPPALLQGLPGCVVTVDEIQRPPGCFQALVRQDSAYGYFFDCLIYGSQRISEARKLAAAIPPSKAFGKHVQHLLKFNFQALELRPQDRCRDFRQEMSATDQLRSLGHQSLQSTNQGSQPGPFILGTSAHSNLAGGL